MGRRRPWTDAGHFGAHPPGRSDLADGPAVERWALTHAARGAPGRGLGRQLQGDGGGGEEPSGEACSLAAAARRRRGAGTASAIRARPPPASRRGDGPARRARGDGASRLPWDRYSRLSGVSGMSSDETWSESGASPNFMKQTQLRPTTRSLNRGRSVEFVAVWRDRFGENPHVSARSTLAPRQHRLNCSGINT